jgi:predicted phosphodiesterase
MALKRIADCGADVLLSGHLHEVHVGHTAERYRIEGLSALIIQAGTATSSRTRESPNSFNLIRIDGRRIEVEAWTWTGADFVPGRSQAFLHSGLENGWSVADAPRA